MDGIPMNQEMAAKWETPLYCNEFWIPLKAGNSMNSRTNISFQEGMRMIATIPLLITLSLRISYPSATVIRPQKKKNSRTIIWSNFEEISKISYRNGYWMIRKFIELPSDNSSLMARPNTKYKQNTPIKHSCIWCSLISEGACNCPKYASQTES